MEALRANRIKSGKFSCYYMSRLDEGSLLLLLFSQFSPSNETDALTRRRRRSSTLRRKWDRPEGCEMGGTVKGEK